MRTQITLRAPLPAGLLCHVRKNRIVTVKLTVSAFERVPRCELMK